VDDAADDGLLAPDDGLVGRVADVGLLVGVAARGDLGDHGGGGGVDGLDGGGLGRRLQAELGEDGAGVLVVGGLDVVDRVRGGEEAFHAGGVAPVELELQDGAEGSLELGGVIVRVGALGEGDGGDGVEDLLLHVAAGGVDVRHVVGFRWGERVFGGLGPSIAIHLTTDAVGP
jgi:hypothetical protein